ncbi:MAG TPA: class I SAM-dependent methyltransferase [Microbacteriaceae bacterium]|nr:class I SAM-dependent methyltransferase [Microbacteriaceae bacterium]
MEWTSFFAASAGRAPRPLVRQVLERRGDLPAGVALDLGCGDGTEARFLAARGWRVHAYDGAPGTPARVRAGVSGPAAALLTATRAAFEDLASLPDADLVYAGHALPFCPEESFATLWQAVRDCLRPGAWLIADFFGPRDLWVGRTDMSFRGRTQIEALLGGLDAVRIDEVEGPAGTPFGPKHLHLLTAVAHRPVLRRPPAPASGYSG